MAKRCEHCKYYVDIVFIQETESGYGLWEGECRLKGITVRNLWFACEDFQPKGDKNGKERKKEGKEKDFKEV